MKLIKYSIILINLFSSSILIDKKKCKNINNGSITVHINIISVVLKKSNQEKTTQLIFQEDIPKINNLNKLLNKAFKNKIVFLIFILMTKQRSILKKPSKTLIIQLKYLKIVNIEQKDMKKILT